MKYLFLFSMLMLSTISLARELQLKSEFAALEQCRVVDQSGTSDRPYCADHRPIRCYADVTFGDGRTHRVMGSSCWATYYDCHWYGAGAVDPCP